MKMDQAAQQGAHGIRHRLKERAVDEARRFAIITLYLWVVLAVFSLHRTLILRESHLDLPAQGFAIVNAFVLAKVMLVAEHMQLGQAWFRSHPAMYRVLLRSLVFAAILVGFHVLEGSIVAYIHHVAVTEELAELNAGWSGSIAVGFMMFVILIPFFAFREMAAVMGSDNVWRLFFRRRA